MGYSVLSHEAVFARVRKGRAGCYLLLDDFGIISNLSVFALPVERTVRPHRGALAGWLSG